MSARHAMRTVLVIAVVVLAAACGGDDGDDAAPGTSDTSAEPDETTTSAASADDAPSDAAVDCPEVADVTAAIGRDMAVDAGTTPPGATALCPYKSADGEITASYLFADTDVTADASGEPLDGIGESAFWEEDNSELWVWTGDQSIVVSVLNFGLGTFDQREAATNMIELVLD